MESVGTVWHPQLGLLDSVIAAAGGAARADCDDRVVVCGPPEVVSPAQGCCLLEHPRVWPELRSADLVLLWEGSFCLGLFSMESQ